jgi:cytochrome c biogenesis protein CcdA
MQLQKKKLSPLAKLGIGFTLVIILLVIGYRFGGSGVSDRDQGGTINVSDAEVCLRAGGTIYFNVTYGTETYLKKIGLWESAEPKLNYSQPFVFSASTHVGTIMDLDLEGKVFLNYEGVNYPAVGKAISSTTHHNTWLIFLPKFDMQGESIFSHEQGAFEIYIEGVDIPEHRVFHFNFPLPLAAGTQISPERILMLVGATMAAMLLTCTPCLVGSLTVGSLAMGSVWGSDTEHSAETIRKQMVRQTLYYLGALVLGYAAVAIAASAFEVSLENIRPIEVMGGVLLVIVGLIFLRSWNPIIQLENAIVRLIVKLFPKFSTFTTEDEPDANMGSSSSTAMGASLAMVCSVAGAPTLTTAIIFPVMIFAGLNDIYWSLLILLAYLVVTAIPFFFIAIGLGEFLYNLSVTLRNRLLVANAFVLIGLGAMLIVSPEDVAGVLSIPARLILEPLSILF